MAKLSPFQGVLYDPAGGRNVRDVVAPPYDVIEAESQHALYARHPHNVIRLELGMEYPDDGPHENRYTRAARHLQDWMKSGTLKRDSQPAIYPYTIEYRPPSREPSTAPRVLKSFFSVMQLEDFGAGRVLPHENTRVMAKTDRLNLLEACRANFSPIFSLFSDPGGHIFMPIEKVIGSQPPRIEFEDDDGFRQRLWAITDPEVIQDLTTAVTSKPLFIADGHHRYETALAYRNRRREQAGRSSPLGEQPWEGVLMLCASLEDPGLTVLPTHRVLTTPLPPISEIRQRLRDRFAIEEFPFEPGEEQVVRARFLRALCEQGRSAQTFGLAVRDLASYLLLVPPRGAHTADGMSPCARLDVSVLHGDILTRLSTSDRTEPNLLYTKDDDEALDLVRRGTAEAAFLLNPTKVSEVSAVAAAGLRMPHKSTYFFPKPLTGLVLRVMEEDYHESENSRR